MFSPQLVVRQSLLNYEAMLERIVQVSMRQRLEPLYRVEEFDSRLIEVRWLCTLHRRHAPKDKTGGNADRARKGFCEC